MGAKVASKAAPKRSAAKKRAGEGNAAGFSEAEKAAVRERAAELKAEARRAKKKGAGLQDMLAKVAALPQPDRGMAERLHEVITRAVPQLEPTTWYGMPAWALEGKRLCFFQPASKFSSRYAMLGFNDVARLDEGHMWPAYYAVTEVTPEVAERVAALVRRAAGL